MPLQTTPSAPSAPPAPPAQPAPTVVLSPGPRPSTSPADIFQAFKAQRRELARQLEALEERRGELSERLSDPMVGGPDRAGIEQRIAEVDRRIAAVDQQIAAADADIARAAGVPGAAVEPPEPRNPPAPEEIVGMSLAFTAVLLLPLVIAYARRIWRRSAGAVAALPRELSERLGRLEEAVDAIAVEVERIGEGQRFVARFFSDNSVPRALGVGAAQPVELKSGEAAERLQR